MIDRQIESFEWVPDLWYECCGISQSQIELEVMFWVYIGLANSRRLQLV